MAKPNPTASIKRARQAFFDDGAEPRGLVPNDILASWRRCRQMGLSADHYSVATPVEQHAINEMQERYETLRKLCRPELESLYASANRADSIIILTAPDGFILDALGNPDFLDKASRVSLRPGVPWNEQVTGTNAIGTAIVERRSVEVRGAEHYYVPHRILSCSATPIFCPSGSVLGVLDMSGEAALHHPLALGMVRLAVEQIERRLFEGKFNASDILRIAPNPDLIGSVHEGMLVFEDHRLVAANRPAMRLLGLDRGELGKLHHRELFASALPHPGNTADMRCQDGKLIYARRDAPSQTTVAMRVAHAPRTAGARTPGVVFSPALEAEIDRGVRLLDADIPVLLQGETGTGKEVVARELHRRSTRGAKTFVAVNCAALPESLIEAELFGYVPGAFTGAKRDGSRGLLRDADGGTLFLDEIGDMPLGLQSRLLRVLQEREVTPIGSSRAFAIDISVVSATHNDLADSVARGAFRADLYYRIAQAVVCLSPLREYADPASMIRELWGGLGARQPEMHLGPALVRALAELPWPGNVRQLVGVLRSLRALGTPGATLAVADLPNDLRQVQATPTAASGGAGDLRSLEYHAIDAALKAAGGNVSEAARKLGVSRSTIYRRLNEQSVGP